ncbi:flagellar FlbD family protein [Bacillota bacterium Meth-B3]|nr:flagellar FlbD family protein [Christensenellaceae bacterium]MEA5064523.1 flagellar FlbD family protein [Eubacteriales bacterium]MEA5068556.1 flagellar FlbD family protein [Christensenellaceae bacterium]
MIKLTKLNGDACYLNPGLFEMIETVPDTLITMANGRKYYVRESAVVVTERVEAYRAHVLARARDLPHLAWESALPPSFEEE